MPSFATIYATQRERLLGLILSNCCRWGRRLRQGVEGSIFEDTACWCSLPRRCWSRRFMGIVSHQTSHTPSYHFHITSSFTPPLYLQYWRILFYRAYIVVRMLPRRLVTSPVLAGYDHAGMLTASDIMPQPCHHHIAGI